MNRRRFEAAVVLFFAAVAIAMMWPLATHLRTAVPDPWDPKLNAWILDWDVYALTHAPLHLFDAPIYHPAKYPLAYSENLVGIALFALPLRLAGAGPLTAYNILLLLGFVHAAVGAYVLARLATRSIASSLVAAIFFAFVSFKFDHLSHIQVVWSGWLPLILAALLWLWRGPSVGRAVLLAGAFVMNGLTNIYFLLFASVAIVFAIVFLAIVKPDLRALASACAALVVASVVLLPVLLPYRTVSRLYGSKRTAQEVADGSATWDDWLRATSRSRLYGPMQDPDQARAERQLFPGLLPIALVIVAAAGTRRTSVPRAESRKSSIAIHVIDAAILIALAAAWIGAVTKDYTIDVGGRRIIDIDNAASPVMLALALITLRLALSGRLRDFVERSRFSADLWTAALWIAIGVVGSLGMHAFLHSYLYSHVGPFQGMRAAARWAIVAYAGMVPWVALGAERLTERRWQPAIACALVAAAIFETIPRIQWQQTSVDAAPVYRWLARERLGPLLELPMHTDWGIEFGYVFDSSAHHLPMLNGTSGWEPPSHERLRWRIERGQADDIFMRTVEDYGAKVVVLHPDAFGNQRKTITDWVSREIASGHLAFLRRFDGGLDGDYVLGVTRNLREWPRYGNAARDGANLTESGEFDRMLRGDGTYSSRTFGATLTPNGYGEIHGPLHVSGWALSRSGVTRVDVLLQMGSVRLPAAIVDRPEIRARYPWYRGAPGFDLVVAQRPPHVARDTDVQIEVVDGAGHMTRLPDVPFWWH